MRTVLTKAAGALALGALLAAGSGCSSGSSGSPAGSPTGSAPSSSTESPRPAPSQSPGSARAGSDPGTAASWPAASSPAASSTPTTPTNDIAGSETAGTTDVPGQSTSSSLDAELAAQADLPGSAWRISPDHRGRGGAQGGEDIQGYADTTSVAPGQSFRLFVSTSAKSFVVRAFRMGWYRGRLGRQVWVSRPLPGHAQPGPSYLSEATHTVTAAWQPSTTVSTRGWLPGDYLLRLDSATGQRSFVPITVRAPSAAGRVVLVSPVTTWQAYNLWGCCDLYQGADGSFANRSRAVTFDRPYQKEQGAGDFVNGELGILAQAERLKIPLDYVTDVDLQEFPGLLTGARAVISMGHDEYWSVAMRAAVTAARDHGTNLAFFGANAIFRRIRFAPTATGPDRLVINYKVASEDPLDHRGARWAPFVTADWPAQPDPDPESSLIGAQYGCYLEGAPYSPGVIVDARNWMFRGAHVTNGEQLPGLIGPEVDAVQTSFPTPRPIEVLMHSPASCPRGVPAAADATYYVAKSGAGVFDAGSIAWACAVGNKCYHEISGPTTEVTRQVTDNILRAFALGPAGRRHPAHDNLAALGIG